MDYALIGVVAVLGIVAVTVAAPRLGVAAPLLLVVLGVAISFVPAVPALEIEPEWILAGVLPPLLYSSAVSMPAMDFRRDLGTIGGLSVLLVVLSSVVIGWFFSLVLPDIGLATGIALGAVVSPTDAVATSIVRRLGVPPRVITVLEGESLLNDATALVLLRSAIAATAASVSLWGVAGQFLLSVVVAVAIGLVVGLLGLRLRSRIQESTATTAISFVVPFVAFIPVERLGASGLVAAVTAGLVTGQGSARWLRPQDRIAEEANWATIELLLEGGIFLVMGLELFGLVDDLGSADGTLGTAVWLGAAAVVLALLLRAAFISPLLWALSRSRRRGIDFKGQLTADRQGVHDRIEASVVRSRHPEEARERWRERIIRKLADIDYLAGSPLGPREGGVLVWAGMRGAVTLAAGQSLPADTPRRALLVLIAFVVAAGSLLVQGGTLPWVVRRLGVTGRDDPAADAAERDRLLGTISDAARALVEDPDLARADGTPYDDAILARVRKLSTRKGTDDEPRTFSDQSIELRLRVIAAQRDALLHARSQGIYSSAALTSALEMLDADQISTELRGGPRPGGS